MITVKQERNSNSKRRGGRGFTLVEIIVTLVILSVVAAVSVPTILGFVDDGKARECKSHRETLAEMIVSERLQNDMDGQLNTESAGGGKLGEKESEGFTDDDFQALLSEHADLKCPDGGEYTLEGNAITCTMVDHADTVTVASSDGYSAKFEVYDATTEEEVFVPTEPPTEEPAPETDPTEPETETESETESESESETEGQPETEEPTEAPTEKQTEESESETDEQQTESETEEPDVKPDAAYPGMGDDTLAAGSWYDFCMELELWAGDYTAGTSGHKRLFYVEDPLTKKKTYYVFVGTNGGSAGNASSTIDGRESPEEYNKKMHDTQVVQIPDKPIDYDELLEQLWEDGKNEDTMIGMGYLVYRNGNYYVSCHQNAKLGEIRDGGNGGSTWYLLESDYVEQTTVTIGDLVYQATRESTIQQLDPNRVKWFDSGNLLVMNDGGVYVCVGSSFKVPGQTQMSSQMAHFEKMENTTAFSEYTEERQNEQAKKGELVKYRGRFFYCCAQNGAQYKGITNGHHDSWLLLR